MANKYLISSVLSLALMGGVASCTKNLDESNPTATTTGNAYKTQADFTAAVNGLYTSMLTSSFYGGSDDFGLISTFDVITDNLIRGSSGRSTQGSWYTWGFSATTAPDVMGGTYLVIREANMILANIDNLADGTFKNNIKGQALAARALMHFELLRTLCKPFTGAQAGNPASDLGMPYVTGTDLDAKPSRPVMQDTYTDIVNDLSSAVDLIGTSNGVYLLNKNTVYGFLSRVYLWGGDYPNCIAAANSCLGTNPNVGTITTFPNIWTDANTTGVLFELLNTQQATTSVTIGFAYNQSTTSGGVTTYKDEYVSSYSLAQELDSAGDVRYYSYIDSTSSNPKYSIIKYLQKSDGTTKGIVNVKVLRTAEVLLNRAEAYYRSGDQSNALSDLNRLRQNRYPNFTDGTETGDNLLNQILLQRRLELAFEGDRWFTLKRLGLPVQRDNYTDNRDGSTGVPYPDAIKTLDASSYKWLFPIPQFELTTNSNMVQNDGYGQ